MQGSTRNETLSPQRNGEINITLARVFGSLLYIIKLNFLGKLTGL